MAELWWRCYGSKSSSQGKENTFEFGFAAAESGRRLIDLVADGEVQRRGFVGGWVSIGDWLLDVADGG